MQQRAGGSTADPDGTKPECWGASHEAEARFQRENTLRRKVQALKDGHLLPAEGDDELEAFILALKPKDALLQAASITAEERKKRRLYMGPATPQFMSTDTADGQTAAYVCPGAAALPLLRARNLQRAHAPEEANVFVVAEELGDLPEPAHLCAILRGAYVVNVALLRDGSGQGLCLKFKGVGHLKRHVWVSDKFKEDLGFRDSCHVWRSLQVIF